MEKHDVLVVGAGPAGLATAVGLARYGIDVLVVERHAGTSPFPKATGVSTRTMELMRSWGLAERVRAGAIPVRALVSTADTLVAPELAIDSLSFPTEEQALRVSPMTPVALPQDHLEPVLAEHLIERGGVLRFRTELTGLRITERGVRAELHDSGSGRRYRVDARYLVGADGPRSTVRAALGIGLADLGVLGDFVAITFRAELTRQMSRVPGWINVVQNPAAAGLFVPTSTDDRWIYATQQPAEGFRAADWSTDRVLQLLRAGSGLPDLTPQIISVLPFTMAGQLAAAVRTGPAFLVGDAVHRTTPMGGIGMNTALHAAHNLSWKLAWVLRGWAGPALLDSYAQERLPIGESNVRRSLLAGPDAPADWLQRDLDVHYRSVVLGRQGGRRAPHAWIHRNGTRISTLDLFDGRLTVLTGRSGAPWRAAAARIAGTGLPITTLAVGAELLPVDRTFAERYPLTEHGAVLVRPDGFIAWQTAAASADPAAELATAVHRTVGLATAAPGLPAGPARSARPLRPARPAPQPCRPAA